MGKHYYNGYRNMDTRPLRFFVEYRLSDGSVKTAGYKEEDAARSFADMFTDSTQCGGCSLVRVYRIWRKKEVDLVHPTN